MQASELAAFINRVARLTGSTGLLALREGKPLSRSPMREKGPAPLPQTPSPMEGFPFQTIRSNTVTMPCRHRASLSIFDSSMILPPIRRKGRRGTSNFHVFGAMRF